MSVIGKGAWGDNLAWEVYETTTPPPAELCTAVMCVAVREGKVVLARSVRGWGMLGGHIEDGESLEEALKREALEEGGFRIDNYGQFAVRKIVAKTPVSHERSSKAYPFPVSYITYYWATTSAPLVAPEGEEVLESGTFEQEEIGALETPDQAVIEAGWKAYKQEATVVTEQIDELKFFTDGGSRGNPGPSASGIVILTMENEVLEEFGLYLGETTNNVAEWTAVKLAFEAIEKYGPRRVHAYMDSELVCRQLNGQYRVKNPGLQPIYREVIELAKRYDVTFEHVYREKNKLADAQVNGAIDRALGLKK